VLQELELREHKVLQERRVIQVLKVLQERRVIQVLKVPLE
jgi:hypothetical protein